MELTRQPTKVASSLHPDEMNGRSAGDFTGVTKVRRQLLKLLLRGVFLSSKVTISFGGHEDFMVILRSHAIATKASAFRVAEAFYLTTKGCSAEQESQNHLFNSKRDVYILVS
jgi:hypothetical protein